MKLGESVLSFEEYWADMSAYPGYHNLCKSPLPCKEELAREVILPVGNVNGDFVF